MKSAELDTSSWLAWTAADMHSNLMMVDTLSLPQTSKDKLNSVLQWQLPTGEQGVCAGDVHGAGAPLVPVMKTEIICQDVLPLQLKPETSSCPPHYSRTTSGSGAQTATTRYDS